MKQTSFQIIIKIAIAFFLILGLSIGAMGTPLDWEVEETIFGNGTNFIGNRADLFIHLNINSKEFNNTKKQSKASLIEIELKKYLLEIADINLENEFYECIDGELDFALYDNPNSNELSGWLFVIPIKEKEKGKMFLEEYWLKEDLEGYSTQIDSYQDIKFIKKVQSINKKIEPLTATTLIDNTILFASSKDLLKNAIDLNLLKDKKIIKMPVIEEESMIGVFQVSPHKLKNWFGIPIDLNIQDEIKNLTGIIINKNDYLESLAFFQFKNPILNNSKPFINSDYLLKQDNNSIEGIARLSEPSKFINNTDNDPIYKLINPVIRKILEGKSPLITELMESSNEDPLLWLNSKKGWAIGTEIQNQNTDKDYKKITAMNTSDSELTINNETFTITSKPITKEKDNTMYLESRIESINSQADGISWWSDNLEGNRVHKNLDSIDLKRESSTSSESDNDYIILDEVLLKNDLVIEQLKHWNPWLMIEALLGSSITNNVKDLYISIGKNNLLSDSTLQIRARIKII